MAQKTKNSMYSTLQHKENARLYQRMQESKVVRLRLNTDQRCLLGKAMEEKGYLAVSSYIKDTLFGYEPEGSVASAISEGDHDMMARQIRESMLDVAKKYTYVLERYNRDMAILNQTEGVDVEKWIRATEKWHLYLIKSVDEMFRRINMVADALGLSEGWNEASPQVDETDPEAMQRESARMRMERIADGHGTLE